MNNNTALSDSAIHLLKDEIFCIVGCGGVGANFAEILVRSGVRNLILIDGDDVEISNLNRVFSFCLEDIGKRKVHVLKEKLNKINKSAKIKEICCHLGAHDSTNCENQEARNSVLTAGVVIMAMDNWKSRFEIFDMLYKTEKKSMSIGINFSSPPSTECRFDITWKPYIEQNKRKIDEYINDYGDGNFSRASILLEASAVAFEFMLYNLLNPEDEKHRQILKSYSNYSIITQEK